MKIKSFTIYKFINICLSIPYFMMAMIGICSILTMMDIISRSIAEKIILILCCFGFLTINILQIIINSHKNN